MSEQIVVLVSEGDAQRLHIDYAIETANEREASLHGVYVIDAWRFGEYSVYGWDVLAREEHEQKAEATLEEIRDRCEQNNVEFVQATRIGKPGKTILNYVRGNDIDTVVCGAPVGNGTDVKSPCLHERLEEESSAEIEVI